MFKTQPDIKKSANLWLRERAATNGKTAKYGFLYIESDGYGVEIFSPALEIISHATLPASIG
ncbi:MAG: hypothetical protein IJV67_05045 [Clostridia bacterium]|nr:hypothetical protein [Clostridia bacterium]